MGKKITLADDLAWLAGYSCRVRSEIIRRAIAKLTPEEWREITGGPGFASPSREPSGGEKKPTDTSPGETGKGVVGEFSSW